MNEYINESIDHDYHVVTESYFDFMKTNARKLNNDNYAAQQMLSWYHSLLAKLNSMRAEFEPCQ